MSLNNTRVLLTNGEKKTQRMLVKELRQKLDVYSYDVLIAYVFHNVTQGRANIYDLEQLLIDE